MNKEGEKNKYKRGILHSIKSYRSTPVLSEGIVKQQSTVCKMLVEIMKAAQIQILK